MSNQWKMCSFNVYAKVRTNVPLKNLFYDIKIHNGNGSPILSLKRQPLNVNGMIGPHETRKIAINSANSYIKEVMLYKNIGGNLIPLRKHPYIIPYHLEEFKGRKINPKLLEATLDYFESEAIRGKNKVVTVGITKKECAYIEFINKPFRIFALNIQPVENVGALYGHLVVKGEFSVKNEKVFVYAEGTTNAAHPTTGDGILHFLGIATLRDGNKILKKEIFKVGEYLTERKESDWLTKPRYNPHPTTKPIGHVNISLPKPICQSDIRLELEFSYQVERAGAGSFTSYNSAKEIFQLKTVIK